MCPPSACTAAVIGRWRVAAARVVRRPEKGAAQPSMFGAKPPDTAASTFSEIRLEAREFLRVVLESRVHRAHQDAIAQFDVTEVEGREQVRVGRVHVPQLKLPRCSVVLSRHRPGEVP